jgi:hypothetical protein
MKNLKYIASVFLFVMMTGMMTSCGEDEVAVSLEELRNDGFDLAIVNDANPYVNVAFTVKGTGIQSVTVSATLAGDTEPTTTASLGKINVSSLNRVNMRLPFPPSNEAPSGSYTISYSYTVDGSSKEAGSYTMSVINNRPPAFCEYDEPLPDGTNLLIKLYIPTAAQMPGGDNTLYATGSFEGWTGGGNPSYAFTPISATCFVLAVNMPDGAAFKITRGGWSKEAQGYTKGNFSDRIYGGESEIEIAIYDFGDTDFDLTGIDAPSVGLEIPSAAVAPGMMTVVANVINYDVEEGDYYVVEEGATSLDDAVLMTPFESKNSLAAAVPKVDGVSYVIVKDELDAEGSSLFGIYPVIEWDGETNPVQVSIGSFDGGITSMYMTGSATDGWSGGASYPIPRVSPGIYEATFNITGDANYLLLPSPGDFGNKFGYASGTASSGTLAGPGSGGDLFTSGLATGSYTVTLNFTGDVGTYTLTPVNP